jgi:cyanate permease
MYSVPLSPFALHRGSTAMSRSVLAVAMGYITLVILVILTFTILAAVVPEMLNQKDPSREFLLITLIAGWLSAVPAGFLTALLAKENECKHAGMLLVVIMLLGFITLLLEDGAKPLWWHVGMIFGVIPFAFLGVWVRARTKKPKTLLGRLFG